MTRFAILFCLLLCALAARAQAGPAFDPRGFRDEVKGPLTRVFVLGSPHLSGAPEDFDPAVLEPLLDRLAAFGPSVIAVENLSGESAHALNAYKAVYPEVAASYAGRILEYAALARAELGLDMPAAEAEARRLADALPGKPSPAARRRLAAAFAASGDPFSAVVQWKQLPERERRAGDGVSSALAGALTMYSSRRNESVLIGAELAARLGLKRVYPTDDHSADDILLPHIDALEKSFAGNPEIKKISQNPVMKRLAGASKDLTGPEETLAAYRMLNSDEMVRGDPAGQWLVFLKNAFPENLGRRRIAEWEARNLRMVAHIREAFAHHPGENVLVIVGSAHKPYFDAYLDLMHDVEIVHASEVLD